MPNNDKDFIAVRCKKNAITVVAGNIKQSSGGSLIGDNIISQGQRFDLQVLYEVTDRKSDLL